jgi:dTDP-L-rhamnose 4-epimerase
MSGKPINVFEDGTESRDFVFIDDVARVTAAAIMDDRASGYVFNVGTGVPTDVMTVATALNRKLNGNSPITVTGNFRIGDIRHNFASLERIERVLGFKPRVSFDEGLDRFCAWVRTIGAVTSDYEGSLAEMKSKGLMK